MQVRGMLKTSLLDFPGRIAAVLFTGGCNMKCVFCHNSSLVCAPENEPVIPTDEVLCFLNKRRTMLQGVVVTGGEPTLSPDLPEFLRKIKAETGLAVKLDTNGTDPNAVKSLLKNKLVDYIAMDIKNDLNGYDKIAGADVDTLKVLESIRTIKSSGIPYEFRTTVVREYFTKEVFEHIGKMLEGADKYYLQQFRMNSDVIGRGKALLNPCSKKEMLEFQQILSSYVSHVELRGVD